MKYILYAVILCIMPFPSNAGFILYTGKFKVHGDKCYQQVKRQSSKVAEWEEFDCITYLENMHFNQEILSNLQIFHSLMTASKISEKAYMEILDSSMSALAQKSYINKKVILNSLQNDISAAQEKYPIK